MRAWVILIRCCRLARAFSRSSQRLGFDSRHSGGACSVVSFFLDRLSGSSGLRRLEG